MRKIIVATLVAAMFAVSLPAPTHAQEIDQNALNQQVIDSYAHAYNVDQGSVCASINNTSGLLWGSISYLSGMMMPGITDPVSQVSIYAPLLAIAYANAAAYAYAYWYFSCSQV